MDFDAAVDEIGAEGIVNEGDSHGTPDEQAKSLEVKTIGEKINHTGEQRQASADAGNERGEHRDRAPEDRVRHAEDSKGTAHGQALEQTDGNRADEDRANSLLELDHNMLIVHVAQWRQHDDLTFELAAIAEKIKESETHNEYADDDARDFAEDRGKIVNDPVDPILEDGDNIERVEGKAGENVREKVLQSLDSPVQSTDELGAAAFIDKIRINGIRLAINLDGDEGQRQKDDDDDKNEADQCGNRTVLAPFRKNFDH